MINMMKDFQVLHNEEIFFNLMVDILEMHFQKMRSHFIMEFTYNCQEPWGLVALSSFFVEENLGSNPPSPHLL